MRLFKQRSVDRLILNVLNAVVPVLAAFAIGAVIILLVGADPLTVYGYMLGRTLFTWPGFLKTLHFAAPLILTGLAIAITFKANIFNMGVEGQLLGGAFAAGILGSSLTNLPAVLHIPLCLVTGVVVGVLLAVIPAVLRAYYDVNEIVTTLMLNYAIIEILRVLSQTIYRDPTSGYVSTEPIAQSAMFTRLGGTPLTLFFPLTIIIWVVMYFVFTKSRLGYEVTALGYNPPFTEATGMNMRRKIMTIMLISGAIAGLAGAGVMMSEKFKYTLDFSGDPGLGWDGMLVSLLGSNSPVGVLIAAIFYAALKTGADSISIFSDVPKEIVGIIQGLIILFLAIKYFHKLGFGWSWWKEKFLSHRKHADAAVATANEAAAIPATQQNGE